MPDIYNNIPIEVLEAWQTRPIVGIHIKSSDISTESYPPEFSSCLNWLVPNFNIQGGLGGNNYVQIGQRRKRRARMRFWVNSISGGGQQEIQIPNPATGVNAVWTNNTGSPVQILTAVGTLTTDATVGNRSVYIQYKDAAGNNIARAQDTTAVTASSSVTIWGSQGGQSVNVATGNSFVPLPQGYYVPVGGSVTFTGVLDASDDNWTNIFLTYTLTSPYGIYITSDLNTIQNINTNNLGGPGLLVTAGQIPFGGGSGCSWDSQRPCYATCLGGTGIISTMDQSFSETIERLV
jgi:hypothetical protein